MTRHSFHFGRWLSRYDIEAGQGVRFHRWLPNGEADALTLKASEPTADLRVWFKRTGRMDGGFIRPADDGEAMDSGTISRQGFLESGPLVGQLDISLSDDAAAAISRKDDQAAAVAKHILQLIEAPCSRLLGVLRSYYGQYWLAPWPSWDSRRESLQSALNGINLRRRNPSTKDWERVVIGDSVINITGSVAGRPFFREFLTASDWQQVGQLANELSDGPSPAAVQIGLAHEALDRGDTRIALIDGVTACELAINECLRCSDPVLAKAVQSFWNLPLGAQIVAALSARKHGPIANVGAALEAIDMRNRVVHEGWAPPNTKDTRGSVMSLLRIAAGLLEPIGFKFASADHLNKNASEEQWRKEEIADP